MVMPVNFFYFLRGGALLGLLAPAAAMAHPGHDGHELTWDFGHLAAHPWVTIGCVLIVAGAGWGAWRLARCTNPTQKAEQSR